MPSRKQILQKLNQFYDEIKSKRKKKINEIAGIQGIPPGKD